MLNYEGSRESTHIGDWGPLRVVFHNGMDELDESDSDRSKIPTFLRYFKGTSWVENGTNYFFQYMEVWR